MSPAAKKLLDRLINDETVIQDGGKPPAAAKKLDQLGFARLDDDVLGYKIKSTLIGWEAWCSYLDEIGE
jgi:hypothetical protein